MRLIVLTVAAVVVSGCGSEARDNRADAPEPHPPSAGNWRSLPWELVRVDGKRVTVRYEGGGCVVGKAGHVPVRAVAAEDRRVVTVGVYVATHNPCAGVGLRGTATVRLSDPLGDRRLGHAPVDE